MEQSGYIHKENGSGKIVGIFFYMLSGNKFKIECCSKGRMCMGKQKIHNIFSILDVCGFFPVGAAKSLSKGGRSNCPFIFCPKQTPSTRELYTPVGAMLCEIYVLERIPPWQ
jgi:hypothetical protein